MSQPAGDADGSSAERQLLRRADRRALALIGAMICVSLFVEITTRLAEIARSGIPVSAAEVWVLELTSHAIIFALALFMPRLVSFSGLEVLDWRRAIAVLAGGFLAFGLIHIAAMYALRSALFPLFVGIPYQVEMFAPRHLGYELSKDVFVFLLLLSGFVLSRMIERVRGANAEALHAARTERKLSLKSGAGVVVLDAGDIVWAKAAGNYVEVYTAARMHFSRITLTQLEQRLAAASDRHVRVHRSHLVNLDHVTQIAPSGEGDVNITLTTGAIIPGSRRFRDRLAAIEQRS